MRIPTPCFVTTGEITIRELRALICVEDLRRPAPLNGFFERFDAEVGRQRVRNAPCGPVEDRDQVPEPVLDGNIGNAAAPHVIRASNAHPTL